MGFEFNPADDLQPTKEEWEQYELIRDLQATAERVRALLAAWQAAVTVCEHSFGPASHLGKMMIDQLQAALDGKGE